MKFSRKLATLPVAGAMLLTVAACGGTQQPVGESEQPGTEVQEMTMLIGSSGDAETNAVQAAVDAWGETSGVAVKVIAAADLNQELAQGFAGDAAPDLFYMSWDQFQTYASDQYLEPYAQGLPNVDAFYPALRDMFSFEGTFVCAPKDFSTLGLVINTGLWQEAGLPDADIPTTWEELKSVAAKLTSGDTVGLAMGAEYARVGVFMAQNGGGLMTDGAVTANSDQNVQALEYLQGLLSDGSLKWPSDLGAGWAGEAFGKQTAAMVIEGPWIAGALKNDFPDVDYQVVELPAGPVGKGTFTFSNCWGIPEGQATAAQATELVTFLTSDEQQLKFADAFAVIPSTQSAAATYAERFPENHAFVAGVEYATTPLSIKGASDVVGELNNAITQLGSGDARAILDKTQGQLESLVG
ncbi:MAG: extracellular solute-binding protein [Propionicimonas sp.]